MSILIAMCLYSLSMSISPGPVNMTILSGALNFGFKRSFSFITGATAGFTLLLIAVGLGISAWVAQLPIFDDLLRFAGTGYMCYIGCKIIVSRPDMETRESQPPRFSHGFLMQWLNPKAWIACLSGTAAFGLDTSAARLWAFVAIYFIICYLSLAAWGFLGSKIQFLATVKNGILVFNLFTGGSIILVAIYLLIPS